MSLPKLQEWQRTKQVLHDALQIVLRASLIDRDPQPNDLQYSTVPTHFGATSGELTFGGVLELHYVSGDLVYRRDGEPVFAVDINGKSQTEVFDHVFKAFAEAGLDLDPTRDKITGLAPFVLDLDQASGYAALQWHMYMTLSMLKGRLYGPQTPVALWPHGFDLSTLWFPGAMDEQNEPHINFGFSPGTPDVGQPYVYFYTWPVPDQLPDGLPEMMTWNTAWSTPGGLLEYEKFRDERQPELVVVELLTDIYQLVAPLLTSR
jgi:hypothetical protein